MELGMRPLVAHCHTGLGRLQRHMDRHEDSDWHVATGITMYREMGMNYWLELADPTDDGAC